MDDDYKRPMNFKRANKMNNRRKKLASIFLLLILGIFVIFFVRSCHSSAKPTAQDDNTNDEMVFSEFQWPKSEIATLISEPKSNIGHIEWEASDGFVIYVSETSKEDYDTYVDDCWDKGFTQDYSKGDDYFWADNENGYQVTVRFEENNVMFIRMDGPPEDFEPKKETDHGVSDFDLTANQTITFCGIKFLIPAYFDVRADDSEENEYEHYYPKEELYYASLVFLSVDANGMTLNQFSNAALKNEGASVDKIKSEDIVVAGLPAIRLSYRDVTELSTANYCFILDSDTDKIISICLVVDDADESNYDYLDDYQKALESAELITSTESTSDIRPEFEEAMESYEKFFDEYVAFMKKYSESSNPISLMSDYASYMQQYSDAISKMEAIDENELSNEELLLYTDTMNRITQKLLEVTQ